MSITPQVLYNATSDVMKGLTSIGEPQIADHSLVFMIKGITRPYKQPVVYYFTNSLKQFDLIKVFCEVIKEVNATGLKTIATVCDHCTVNVPAIHDLINDTKAKYFRSGKEWREDLFIVNNKKIILLNDVPHLIKGIRNNLMTKDLMYYDKESKMDRIMRP